MGYSYSCELRRFAAALRALLRFRSARGAICARSLTSKLADSASLDYKTRVFYVIFEFFLYNENHAMVAWFKKGFADEQKANKKSAKNVLV